MKLSQQTHNGLKIVYELALRYPDGLSATKLSERMYLSPKYLEKILRPLGKAGVVSATRGVNGGYQLAAPPEDLTVGRVVRALEDDMEIVDCVLDPCPLCPTSAVWRKLYEGINQVLDSMTVKQMMDAAAAEKETTCVCQRSGKNGTDLSGSCCNH